jgi:hypothetical protein
MTFCIMAKCCHAECLFAGFHFKAPYAESRFAECCYAECCYAKCCYAECRGAFFTSSALIVSGPHCGINFTATGSPLKKNMVDKASKVTVTILT